MIKGNVEENRSIGGEVLLAIKCVMRAFVKMEAASNNGIKLTAPQLVS